MEKRISDAVMDESGTLVKAKRKTPLVADDPNGDGTPTYWLFKAIGRRYRDCHLDNFEATTQAQQEAVEACRQYLRDFKHDHLLAGRSIVFIGPKGTGKDHLMVATLRQLCYGFRDPGKVVYRDGLTLFAEFRSTMNNRNKSEDSVVDAYVRPAFFAMSDPLPPTGQLSEYEQRMLLRIVDGRYRECRGMAATLNVSSREELESRMGPQAADRLCEDAVIVRCNWESYRTRKGR